MRLDITPALKTVFPGFMKSDPETAGIGKKGPSYE
jgi:hypothetical protein